MLDLTNPSRTRPPVVAVDGPGSSGKTSVGAAAAARLGLRFCDTGLLYRAVTYAARQRGIAEADAEALVTLVGSIRLETDAEGRYSLVTLEGADVTAAVQAPEVDEFVSAYARVPELRTTLLGRQRDIAAEGGVVMAGRDIGTVVLPDADVKVFLDASVEERARRRAEERGMTAGSPEALEILEQLRARDEVDSSRSVAPLRRADGAVVIRTDGIGFEATVDLLVRAIEERGNGTATVGAPEAVAAGAAAATPTKVPDRAERVKVPRLPPIAPTPIATRVTWIIRIAGFVMRLVAGFFTRVVIEGDIKVIPPTGAVLVAANHASNVDPVLIGGYLNTRLGRPFNWMGKRELFDWPFISWLARHGGVHPVERGAADVDAFRTAIRILDGGHMLAVFPEGTRSPDGRLQPAKDGVAVLAARSGALIVPIALINSDRLWPRGRRLPVRTPKVIVRIGEPFYLAEALAAAAEGSTDVPGGPAEELDARGRPSVASRRRSTAAGTELIMRRIAALLPPRQRGAYGDETAD